MNGGLHGTSSLNAQIKSRPLAKAASVVVFLFVTALIFQSKPLEEAKAGLTEDFSLEELRAELDEIN